MSQVRAKQFAVYAVEDVDQALALLSGLEAGDADEQGEYPEEFFNGRVQRRLRALEEKRTQLLRRELDELESGDSLPPSKGSRDESSRGNKG
jgi:hypothetical protein